MTRVNSTVLKDEPINECGKLSHTGLEICTGQVDFIWDIPF